MKGHWIARIDVTEEALYPEYGKRALSAISKFGRRFAVRSGAARHRGADFRPTNVPPEWVQTCQHPISGQRILARNRVFTLNW